MNSTHNAHNPHAVGAHPRAVVLSLAAKAEIDPRTAQRVLERGVAALHSRAARERAIKALRDLGIEAPQIVARDDSGDLVTMRDR